MKKASASLLDNVTLHYANMIGIVKWQEALVPGFFGAFYLTASAIVHKYASNRIGLDQHNYAQMVCRDIKIMPVRANVALTTKVKINNTGFPSQINCSALHDENHLGFKLPICMTISQLLSLAAILRKGSLEWKTNGETFISHVSVSVSPPPLLFKRRNILTFKMPCLTI